MASLLERYSSGDRDRVWDELRRLPAQPDDADLAESWPVVEATMQRVATNIATIVERLNSLGYRWGRQAQENYQRRVGAAIWAQPADWQASVPRPRLDPPDLDEHHYDWSPPSPEIASLVDRAASAVGTLPLALRGLFQFVGAVDLSGSLRTWHPSAFVFDGPEPWPPFGRYSCPLVLYGVQAVIGYIDPETGRIHERYLDRDGSYSIYLGSDRTAGAGFSGGSHMVAPSRSLDPLVSSINGRDPMSLIEYLRWSFAWGGFPGFESEEHPPLEILDLRAELLPI